MAGSQQAERITPRTRRRIVAEARRLGYTPNAAALTLKRGYSDVIVLLVVGWDVVVSNSMATAELSRRAAEDNLAIIVHTEVDEERAIDFLRRVMALNPYGLLLLWDSDAAPTDRFRELVLLGLPVVDLIPSDAPGLMKVTPDRQQGFRLCARHLIDLGHRRIGILLNSTSRRRTSTHKLDGYKAALKEHNVPFDDDLVEELSGVDTEAGYEGTKKLLARRPDVTAVMCISDVVASGALAAAQDTNLAVPDYLSIAGYGADRGTDYLRPSLTTVRPPSAEIADHAIETLMRMREEPGCNPTSFYAPVELVIRHSTGPVRTGDT